MTALTNTESRHLNPRSDPASPWWHIDPTPFAAAIGLSLIGLIAIYSATRGRDPENYVTFFVERQALFVGAGAVFLLAMVFFDYRVLLRLAPLAYLGMCGALALVLIFGVEANGAKSWFAFGDFRLQPSEFAKTALIVVLAAFLSRRGDDPLSLRELLIVIGLALVPVALILRQPDIGTAMILVVIVAAMLMVGRAESHHLFVLVAVTALGVGLLVNSGLLEDYVVERLTSFLDPTIEASYNQRQAQIAIGNGGISGTGFGEGTQTKSNLVPEQQTDFIFTVIGEEFGFTGGSVVLLLYGLLLWRLYRIARLAGDAFGTYLVAGVFAMIAFQMFQSIGMTVGIMPVTGIPLPFVSYGGSSAVSSFLALGLAISVHMRRFAAGIDAEIAGVAPVD